MFYTSAVAGARYIELVVIGITRQGRIEHGGQAMVSVGATAGADLASEANIGAIGIVSV